MNPGLSRRLTLTFSALLVSFITMTGSAPSAAQNRFAKAPVYSLGGVPSSSALADFNGDGDLNGDGKGDLATVGQTALEIRIGNGDGKFKSPVSDSLGGTDANAVLLKDVNGDGKLDVISVNFGTSTVSIFLNNGNGTFRAANQFASTHAPRVIAAGDFNGDGKVGLAVAGATKVSILLGNGTGGFSLAHDIAVGRGINGIAAVGIRGNGIADLVLSDGSASNAIVLYGNGNGTFASPVSGTTFRKSGLYTWAPTGQSTANS